MVGLPILSGKEVVKALSKIGFELIRQRGSHMILRKQTDKEKNTVPVPNHKELAKGTLNSIIKQAGLTQDEFLDLF
jgi:predicted RNA binding protein YcfA (HicA-like mRNA interferase family)